ncbi:MAG: hypothetical protein AB1451_13880 [Nitrospirota bacterium]
MADVKEIKTAVRKDDTATISPGSRRELGEFRNPLELGRCQQVAAGNYNRLPGGVARIALPIYGVARLFPLVGSVSLYATGLLGFNLFFGDAYKGSGSLEGGGHLGAGAGLLRATIQ